MWFLDNLFIVKLIEFKDKKYFRQPLRKISRLKTTYDLIICHQTSLGLVTTLPQLTMHLHLNIFQV